MPDKLLGRKRLCTKGRDGLTVQMKGLRRPSTRLRRPSTRFAEAADLADESEFDEDEEMQEEQPVEEEDDDDTEYKEESGGGYTGTLGRLNTAAYPANYTQQPAGLGGLKVYTIPPGIKQVSKGTRTGSQNATMGQHYRSAQGGQGPLDKKRFVNNLKDKNGSLSATDYGNVFAKNVAKGPKFKRVSKQSKETRHATFQWCHGMACSIGGTNSYENLYAASYDANTFSAVIEDWLRKHINDVEVWLKIELYYQERLGVEKKTVRTSARRAPAYFTYCLYTSQQMANPLKFYVDCRCQGFNAADRLAVVSLLDRHFKIPMDRR